jgi:IS4 transposase
MELYYFMWGKEEWVQELVESFIPREKVKKKKIERYAKQLYECEKYASIDWKRIKDSMFG